MEQATQAHDKEAGAEVARHATILRSTDGLRWLHFPGEIISTTARTKMARSEDWKVNQTNRPQDRVQHDLQRAEESRQ